ncbi:MAG: sulfurtransferase TusA family protein [Bacillota bacterium]|nr:sulfurtransferase TusA family protein [Bacillota bacterium]MDD3297598.1 sulfurtransferase TusA family protein [Bacillota bacterium]MDD3851500.1 sulfurtransferase TusA family protein [Bacillota bacterium]MDD4708255.1 sulfurtransferase TusA family protein [Bacillota bacterium]
MTLKNVDARGRACPEPVLLTKRAIDQSPERVQVFVDNTTAMENVKRFAVNLGYKVEITKDGQDFVLKISR